MGWVVDLDGVVWLAGEPIVGSLDALARLASNTECVFVTNNSSRTIRHYEQHLDALGIDARGAVLSSALAAASLVDPGQRAMVCGGAGVVEALADRGVEVVTDGAVDVVVVGYDPTFDYATLRTLADVVRRGARLVATNDDATYPAPGALLPGTGAIVAAVATASGVVAEVAGKPHGPLAGLVQRRLGDGPGIVVGDRVDTDGGFARRLGYRFALVLSGVTPDDGREHHADLVVADLAAAVSAWEAGALGPAPR